jgi:SAM-dependent methyltransferase
MSLKQVIKRFVPKPKLAVRQKRSEARLQIENLRNATRPLHPRSCPICSYHGFFSCFGRPPRLDAQCPSCEALERHRLFWLWFNADKSKLAEPILHFAPEPILSKQFKKLYHAYRTADMFSDADLKLNIEAIDLATSSLGTVICNHVLEHVSDKQALSEIYRVLSDNGQFVCSVPIIEGWEQTYENETITTPLERELHFGQQDHVRLYGRDFRDRLREAGFTNIQEITAEGQNIVDYGLLPGEKFFLCGKS